VKTGPRERFPLDQVKLIRFQDGSWTEISALIKGR
jgi:hypothetical protein